MKRSLIVLGISAVFGLLLAACGGDAEPTSAPAATQPPAETEEEPPPAAEGYQGGTVSDGGTIAGTITYSGPPVEEETVEVDKDPEICGDEINLVPVQTDGSGGLANAVVRITDISAGKPISSLGSIPVIDQINCQYVPGVVVIPTGESLTVFNSDGILHNINATPFDNPPVNIAQPGTSTEVETGEFLIPEIVPVGCDVHPWMNATAVVTDHPYVAVTGADGSYSLDDVPAGTYTVEVWHPELGSQTMTVTVEAGGTAAGDSDFN